MSEDEIVGNALPFVRLSGIYFLTHGRNIAYIGKSRHLMRRVAQHNNNGVEFDGYYFILCEESRAAVLEEYYIKKFNPPINVVFRSAAQRAMKPDPQWIDLDELRVSLAK
uniref:GIY-YIG domain-containing protein n=1 Tax=Aromatoleum buckelii TaxID=200254 RepID=A0ABX1N8A7_9RHOO